MFTTAKKGTCYFRPHITHEETERKKTDCQASAPQTHSKKPSQVSWAGDCHAGEIQSAGEDAEKGEAWHLPDLDVMKTLRRFLRMLKMEHHVIWEPHSRVLKRNEVRR